MGINRNKYGLIYLKVNTFKTNFLRRIRIKKAGTGLPEFKDLSNEDYIVPTMDQHEDMIRRFWERYDFQPKILLKSNTLEAIRNMVANDLGITIMSDMVYRSLSLEGRRIVKRDLIEPTPSSDVGIAWLKAAKHSLASETFLSLLRSETSQS